MNSGHVRMNFHGFLAKSEKKADRFGQKKNYNALTRLYAPQWDGAKLQPWAISGHFEPERTRLEAT